MTSTAPAPGTVPAGQRRALNRVLAVGIADAVLLLVLLYFAFVDRSDTAIAIVGPIHGAGYVLLLALTGSGALERRWGWWCPAIVRVTAGPPGAIVGDSVLRRRLPDA